MYSAWGASIVSAPSVSFVVRGASCTHPPQPPRAEPGERGARLRRAPRWFCCAKPGCGGWAHCPSTRKNPPLGQKTLDNAPLVCYDYPQLDSIGCEEKEYPVRLYHRERRTVEAPCKAIGEVVSEPRPEIICIVGGDAVPALKGSDIGKVKVLPVSAECA